MLFWDRYLLGWIGYGNVLNVINTHFFSAHSYEYMVVLKICGIHLPWVRVLSPLLRAFRVGVDWV